MKLELSPPKTFVVGLITLIIGFVSSGTAVLGFLVGFVVGSTTG
jgi:hypothetical protein